MTGKNISFTGKYVYLDWLFCFENRHIFLNKNVGCYRCEEKVAIKPFIAIFLLIYSVVLILF